MSGSTSMDRTPRTHSALGRGSFALLVAGLTLLVAGCGSQDVSSGEEEKAAQLEAALAPLGVDMPVGIAASLYGTDGGHLCAAAESDGQLDHVALVGHRFALRKTRVSPQDIAYGRAVIEVYCPDELASYESFVDGLETGKTSDD